MKLRSFLTASLALCAGVLSLKAETKPLRVLIVAGGCCHDYVKQPVILKEGIEARANAIVEIALCPDEATRTKTVAKFPMYDDPNWAKNYDVVIHDECSADIKDPVYVGNIINAHRDGVPAVNLHCAMHCYRWGDFQKPVSPGADNAHWYEMLGLQSTGHGPQEPIALTFVDPASPITKGMANWTTVKEELYNNIQILTAHPLAKGVQTVKNKDGSTKDVETVVAWTNEFGPKKTRIFSTTIGHNNDTVGDGKYLDLITRGLLWATGKIGDDGKPVAGYEAAKK